MEIVVELKIDEKDLPFYSKERYTSKSKLKEESEIAMNEWLSSIETINSIAEFIEDERDKDRGE